MPRTISLLLGSGFSLADDLPTVQQISEAIMTIKEGEIFIHTDQRAYFLNGANDSNRWLRSYERQFLEAFLNFYTTEVLPPGETFNYETFYDFFAGYKFRDSTRNTAIERFHEKFVAGYPPGHWQVRDCLNTLNDFKRTYGQLLAAQLRKTKYLNDTTISFYNHYDEFVDFLAALCKENTVKVHSLNHDLLFDWLGHHHTKLTPYYSDGFHHAGSPFYGHLSKHYPGTPGEPGIDIGYRVKLRSFTNVYVGPLSLYKLHGSIDNIIVYTQPDSAMHRIKETPGVWQLSTERWDEENGRYYFEGVHDRVDPDYLSGTEYKKDFYDSDPHYQTLFGHFQENLLKSDVLPVIGYGFKDQGINEYLDTHFLKAGKKAVVIDPYPLHLPFTNTSNITHIQKKFEHVTVKEYLDNCSIP